MEMFGRTRGIDDKNMYGIQLMTLDNEFRQGEKDFWNSFVSWLKLYFKINVNICNV